MTGLTIGRRAALLSGVAAVATPAVLRAQADPIRIATLTPLTGAGGPYGPVMPKVAAAVVEEHEPVEAWKGESPDAQGNFARFASARNVYLLVHRASGVVRVAPATEIGEVVLNGFAVRFRRLDLGDAPEDAVLVQVRFVVLRVQAQPFATAPEKGRATGDTP